MIILTAAALAAVQPLVVGECAVGRMSAADRTALVAATSSGLRPDAGLIARVRAHLQACKSNDDVQSQAFASAVTLVLAADLRQKLGAKGVDAAVVDRWFDSQSDAAKTDVDITGAKGDAMVRAIVAAGVPAAMLDPNAELVGSYIGTRIAIERIRRGLRPGP